MMSLVEAWHYRSAPVSLTSLRSDRLALWMHEFDKAAPLMNSLAKRPVQGYVSAQNNHDASIPVPDFPASCRALLPASVLLFRSFPLLPLSSFFFLPIPSSSSKAKCNKKIRVSSKHSQRVNSSTELSCILHDPSSTFFPSSSFFYISSSSSCLFLPYLSFFFTHAIASFTS